MNGKTIIFYAPVGTNLPQHLVGGGEVGCRRTREILMKDGYRVITIDKPTMGNGALRYAASAVKSYVRIWENLLADKHNIVYIVGFYERNLFLEWAILMTCSLLRRKTIYEARNGRLVTAYRQYGKLYKALMDSVLKRANAILCQGLEYVEFIRQQYQRSSVYTPNYVLNKNLRSYNGNRPMDVIRLIYFGRLAPSKNIEVVIEVCGELLNRGYKVDTAMIGAYTEQYKAALDRRIAELNIPKDAIRFLGPQPFENISAELQQAHFFVFPSQEKKEGHSNSLTEAMTFGVVPVVSPAGFNRSIVDHPELVINEISAGKYADTIEGIIRENTWHQYSKFVYDRAKSHYTEDIVRHSILTAIRNIGD